MKTCPHCGGEVRPSVIKCVHCGSSLIEDPQEASVTQPVPGAPTAELAAGASEARPPVMPGRPTAPAPSVFDPPSAKRDPDPWVTPSVRADGHGVVPVALGPSTTAVPRTRVRRLNPVLAAAGVAAALAGAIAASATFLPWVSARIATIGERGNVRSTSDLTLRAFDSLAGPFALGVAAAAGILGVVWFWYAMDRATTPPGMVHPTVALVAGAAAVTLMLIGRSRPLLWEGAIVAHAREAGMTEAAMREVLQDPAAHTLDVEPLAGIVRFGVAAGLMLVAGLAAWWSQRARALA